MDPGWGRFVTVIVRSAAATTARTLPPICGNCSSRLCRAILVDVRASSLTTRKRFTPRARDLIARHYNTALATSANKADVNWSTIAELLAALVSLAKPGENIYAVIDRQGGRKFYNGHLSELFAGAMTWVELETPRKSVYK